MIRVMHVCSDTNIGGAGRYLLNLLKEADEQEYELIFVLPYESKLAGLLEKHNGRVIRAQIMPDQSFGIKDIVAMKRLMKKFKPDIVHTHASLSARIAAKLLGIKGLVYTRHYVDTTCMTGESQSQKSLKKTLKGIFNNTLCDGVIGVAYECEPVLLDMGIRPDKITIIPNGVTPLEIYSKEQKDSVKSQYGVPKGYKVITILARLSKEKGQEVFVDVIERLIKSGEAVTGIVAGTGPEAENIKNLIRQKGLENSIIMTGFVENVEAILNITDIQMNTAYTEAQSLALSEGMSIGIPAVVTNVGGNPSMIRDGINGYLAPVGDSAELAKKVQVLLEDEMLYVKVGEAARKVYEEYYTAAKMTRSTEAFYKKTLKNNK